jgi:hypothetical protein
MPNKTTLRSSNRSTQEFVPVSAVRDGIVVLKTGDLRAILLASSINFALNSLDFSCQIFVQSRMLDIRPYLATLEVQYKQQLDDLMRVQIREYIEFIKSFTEAANIMTKNFFVVVPYSPTVAVGKTGMNALLSFGKTNPNAAADANKSFEEQVSQLEQRISIVQQGLIRTGVRTVQLGTEEAIELLYKMFNPGEEGKPMPLQEAARG